MYHPFTWADARLYTSISLPNAHHKIITLESEKRVWAETGVELLHLPYSIFVDHDENLTAIASGLDNSLVSYRFPLK
jgi:hypothetical protein